MAQLCALPWLFSALLILPVLLLLTVRGADAMSNLTTGPPKLWVVDFSDQPMKAVVFASNDEGSGAVMDVSVFRPPQLEGMWYTGYFPVSAKTSTLKPGDARVTTLLVTGSGKLGDPGYPVANPVGWQRKWGLYKGGRQYVLMMPQAPDGYVAMGGYFLREGSGAVNPTQGLDVVGITMRAVVKALIGGGADQSQEVPGDVWSAIQHGVPTSDAGAANTANLVTVRSDLVVPVGAQHVWDDRASGAADDGSIYVATDGYQWPDSFSPGSMIAQSSYDRPAAYGFKKSAVGLVRAE